MKMITINFVKSRPSDVHKKRRDFSSKFRQAFISYCAYKGYFDDIFSQEQIEKAKKGKLPSGLTVHHITPLGGGGINDFSNLCVISKKFHTFLNQNFFDKQLKGIEQKPVGFERKVRVPYLSRVALRQEKKIMFEFLMLGKGGNEI